MSDTTLNPGSEPAHRRSARIWVLLGLLLIALVPLVIRAPLTSDTVMFDLQAKTVTQGGVLYRDILEPNFPGAVWVHLAIRGLGGWSPTWIRIADLLIVVPALLLLMRIASVESPVKSERLPAAETTWAVGTVAAVGFYLTRNEWCHCQRDGWMLLPVGAALWLRFQRTGLTGRSTLWRSIAEGACWGAAFWIKPHVVCGAIAVFAVALLQSRDLKSELMDLAAVVGGGLLSALPGVLWLLHNGSLSAFLDMQFRWNPEYLAAGAERRSVQRVWYMILRFHPWWVVHVAALPLAVQRLMVEIGLRSRHARPADASRHPAAAVAALYLAWLTQAALLQHAMDYIHVAPLILGIAVLCTRADAFAAVPMKAATLAFVVLAVAAAPCLHAGRLAEWPRCVVGHRTWRQLSTLSQGRFPDWQDVGKVTDFLRAAGVRQGDVTCFTTHGIHIYASLQMLPSSRYVGVATLLELFPHRAAEIQATVVGAGARFVVTDDDEVPPRDGEFPWNLPTVYQSGSLRVHAVPRLTHQAGAIRTQ